MALTPRRSTRTNWWDENSPMDALTNNALVDMQGPTFLAFYAVVTAITLVALNLLLRIDSTGERPPPVPTRPDPYEIAYLRGGVGAVIQLAAYALKCRQMIEIQAGGRVARVSGLADPTNPIETRVLEEVGLGETASNLLKSGSLRASLQSKCETFRQRLERQDLVATGSARARAYALTALAGAALVALAAWKIVVALTHHHKNVGFLFIEATAAIVLLVVSVQIVTRSPASQRGRASLNRLKAAYSGYATALASSTSRFDPVASGLALAAVGALGFSALRGTSDEAFANEFTKNSSNGGGGGSCGSGGGDGGGGCGGCGGGGD
jgi:uncharacterized protein (TIGR04222 family)